MTALSRTIVGLAVVLLLALCSATLPSAQQPPEDRLLRFPDIHGSQVVFSYGGDLWPTTTEGGVARRITTIPGLELFPHFSPDGKWIAFADQYEGNFNVYVIPANGGQRRELTFDPDIGPIPERMGLNNQAIAWTPDSKRIVFLSRRDTFNDGFSCLWTVRVDGGLPERLPINRGGLLALKSDGTEAALRSPLTQHAAVVHAGDYLLAMNGRDLRAPQNPYELFVNTSSENVTLTVNSARPPRAPRTRDRGEARQKHDSRIRYYGGLTHWLRIRSA